MALICTLCGCSLASKRQSKFSAWQPAMQVFLKSLMVKPIAESSVISLPCKEVIRRNVGNPIYTPRWKDKCMVVSCQWENLRKIKS